MGIMRKKVTILLPAFNEESSFPIICSNMEQVLADNSEYDWEFLMVNDGSTDNTLLQMERLRQIDPEHYCYIDLCDSCPLDDIISRGPFMGCEYEAKQGVTTLGVAPGLGLGVNPGLGLGVNPGLGLYKKMLDFYANQH